MCTTNCTEFQKTDKIVVEKSTLPVRTAEAIKNILDHTGNEFNFKFYLTEF
jgi:UDPglucose 6-dehydrogenase